MSNVKGVAIYRGKRKVIKLRSGESIMEGNTVEMPFIAPYKVKTVDGVASPITSMKYEWVANENGKNVVRALEVSGHGKLGVPTLDDKEVLRALQSIYVWNKVNQGVVELEKDVTKIKEEDLLIDFKNIDTVARAMGIKSLSGQKRQSIKDSIMRLVATTIVSTQSGGIYDIVEKKYISNATKTFRYLEGMESYSVHDCSKCEFRDMCKNDTDNCKNEKAVKKDVTKIKMSVFMYLSIANNYRVYYNEDNVNQIKNIISKTIYLISRKWINKGYKSIANIQKYLDRIPMNTKSEAGKKMKIKKAVEKLNEYSFCNAYVEGDNVIIEHLDKKKDKTTGKYDKESKEEVAEDTSYMKDKFNKYTEFNAGIIELGLSDEEMDKYIDIQRIEHLRALLRYVHMMKHYKSEVNMKDLFINCINSNKEIDAKYYNVLS